MFLAPPGEMGRGHHGDSDVRFTRLRPAKPFPNASIRTLLAFDLVVRPDWISCLRLEAHNKPRVERHSQSCVNYLPLRRCSRVCKGKRP